MNQHATQRVINPVKTTEPILPSDNNEPGTEVPDDSVVELDPIPPPLAGLNPTPFTSPPQPKQTTTCCQNTKKGCKVCGSRFKYYFEYRAPGRKGINGHLETDTLGNWLSAVVVFILLVPVMLASSLQLVIFAGNLYDVTGPTDRFTVKLAGLVGASFVSVVVLLNMKILTHLFFNNESHRGVLSQPLKSVAGFNVTDAMFDGLHLALQIEVLVALQATTRLCYFVFILWFIHRALCWLSQRVQYSIYFFAVLIDVILYAVFTFPILGVEIYYLSHYVSSVTPPGVPVVTDPTTTGVIM